MKKLYTLLFLISSYAIAHSQVISIPVVFHVVYQNTNENIPDSVLMEQLQVLNKAYRNLGSDQCDASPWGTLDEDTGIEFCLAQQDPQGNFSTGITRTQTTITSFTTDNKVKYASQGGHDIWDRDRYLNIWVCDLGSAILGYSQYPGGNSATDGVVLHYRHTGITGAVAPYNGGVTGVFETGRWLNLYAISSCTSDDLVNDTPGILGVNGPCGLDSNSCNIPAGPMYQNYMNNLPEDACKCIFTTGQKARLQAALANPSLRGNITTSNGCTPLGIYETTPGINFSVYPNPADGKVSVKAAVPISIEVYDVLGQLVFTHPNTSQQNELELDLLSLPRGLYYISSSNSRLSAQKLVLY